MSNVFTSLRNGRYFRNRGYYLIIVSAALAALFHVVGKPLLGTSEGEHIGMNPIVLASVIFLLNGLFFTPLSRKTDSFQTIGSKNLILMILVGIAEVSALIVYFFGLKDSTAVNASIFSNGEIIFSLLVAMVFFKERLHKKEYFPFSMILFGMFALPVGYDLYQENMQFSTVVLGDFLIIFSGFLYAIDINICKYISDRFDSKRITQVTSFASGSFALLIVLVFQIPFDVSMSQFPLIAILSILGTGISTLFFLIALRLIGSMRTILLYSTTSVFGILFSNLFLKEEITMIDFVSIITVIAGIYLLRNKLAEEKIESKESEKYSDPKSGELKKKRFTQSVLQLEHIATKQFFIQKRIYQKICFTLSRFYNGG